MDSREWLKNARIMQGWEIEGLLGRGRHSTVWAIRRGDESAALKVIQVMPEDGELASCERRGLTKEGLVELYQAKLLRCGEEVRIMRLLQGESNFISYQDHEVIQAADGFGGTILVRMERLTSLRSYVEKHGISQSIVVDMAISVANALNICHSGTKCTGFVHGDVKIDNIYYSRDQVFKLGDFGLSMPPDGEASFSGTRGYAAPEAIRAGKQPSGDIYALGITMYTLLNGMKLPVREGTEDLPRPAACVNDKLWQTILRMTCYAHEQRYQNMEQVLGALRGIDVMDPQMKVLSLPRRRTEDESGWTLTNTMARHVLQEDASACIPGADTRQPEPVEEQFEQTTVSQELEASFHEKQQNARRKRKRTLRIAVCAAAVLLLAVGVFYGLMRSGVIAAKQVSMTAVLDQQGRLAVDITDNAKEYLLWISCSAGTAQEDPCQLAGDEQELSFVGMTAPNARRMLKIGEDCHLKFSHLPPDTVCEIALVDAETRKTVLTRAVVIPAAPEAEVIGRVHTLWYCQQEDMGRWLDKSENPYIALRREDKLLRVKDDLMLPASGAHTDEREWFMNVTFITNVEAPGEYEILLRCGGHVVVFCPLDASQVYRLDDNRLTLCLPRAVVESGIGRSGESFTLELLQAGKVAYAFTGQYKDADK